MTALECKCSRRARSADAAHLRQFRALCPECKLCALVYTGSRIEHLGDGVVALPWTLLAGLG